MVAFVWYKEKCRLKQLKCHFTLATHPFRSFSFISVSICTGQVCSHSSFSHFSPRRALAHFHKHRMDTQYKKKKKKSVFHLRPSIGGRNLGFFLLQLLLVLQLLLTRVAWALPDMSLWCPHCFFNMQPLNSCFITTWFSAQAVLHAHSSMYI